MERYKIVYHHIADNTVINKFIQNVESLNSHHDNIIVRIRNVVLNRIYYPQRKNTAEVESCKPLKNRSRQNDIIYSVRISIILLLLYGRGRLK